MKVPPPTDRVLSNLKPSVAPLIPRSVLDTPLGGATIATHFDRAVRVRFDGPDPSTAEVVPETSAARTLLESPAGAGFRELLRATARSGSVEELGVKDDLHAITFTPDEHAAVAVTTMVPFLEIASKHGRKLLVDDRGKPLPDTIGRQFVDERIEQAEFLTANRGAWNAGGDIVLTPDVSRQLLASVDAYRFTGRDDALPDNWTERDLPYIRSTFRTLAHERQHSISPEGRKSNTAQIFEEATADILGDPATPMVEAPVAKRIRELEDDPYSSRDVSGLKWPTWDRDAYADEWITRQERAAQQRKPEPADAAPDEVDDAQTRRAYYQDGPRVIRQLLIAGGINVRSDAGLRTASDVLQGARASDAPRRLADALMKHYGVDASHREDIVRRVKRSVTHPDGSDIVLDRLRDLRSGSKAPD